MNDKKDVTKLTVLLFIIAIMSVLFLVYTPISHAQNWAALPPYNTLWPLWSPTWAPVNTATGLPVPIVDSLFPNTVLPVQPGLTWDPAAANPWLLYNTPLGMAYYEPTGGVNMWPPSYLRDDVGAALPLSLPPDFGFLPAPQPSWLSATVPTANIAAYVYLKTLLSPLSVFGTAIAPTLGIGGGLGLGTPIFPTTFIPAFAGVPLFSPASAFIPPPGALLPPPAPVAIAPPPIVPAPTPLTAVFPSPIAPLPIVPSPIVPPPIPTPVVPLPPTPIAPVISGLLFPFVPFI